MAPAIRRRLVAFLIDVALLFAVLAPLGWLIQRLAGVALPITGPAIWHTLLWNFSLPTWAYFAIADSAPRRGSVGKRLTRLRVADASGQPVRFGRNLARTLVKLLPWEMVHISVFALSESMERLTLPQAIGLAIANGLAAAYLVMAIVTKGRKSIDDVVAGTRVEAVS